MKRYIEKAASILKKEKVEKKSLMDKSWLDIIGSYSTPSTKDIQFRVSMTTSCKDSGYIPKVKNAGSIRNIEGTDYQLMHNGILVECGGYFGDWMSQIIKNLKGHHEPQEEKVFFEILKLLPEKSTMMELGSYWAYYSLWFNKQIKGAVNYCCEPDPKNLQLGRRNAKINGLKNINFINSAAGENDRAVISFKPQEGDFEPVQVSVRTVDGMVEEFGIRRLDVLHMDIQGVELSALEGAVNTIKSGKVRFIIVSTHHFLISEDPLTHEKCLQKIKELGGHIVTEHAVHESFSGDGLIVASFSKSDSNLHIPISINRMKDSLFRDYNSDLFVISSAYENLRKCN